MQLSLCLHVLPQFWLYHNNIQYYPLSQPQKGKVSPSRMDYMILGERTDEGRLSFSHELNIILYLFESAQISNVLVFLDALHHLNRFTS